MRYFTVMVCAGLLAGCTQAQGQASKEEMQLAEPELAFLSGSWTSEHEGEWSEEHWSGQRGKVMMGYGRSGAGDELNSFEFLRIEQRDDGTTVYLAAPGGGQATEFALSQSTSSSAVFENAEHDFPQRISYSREGDELAVEISTLDGDQAIGWTLLRTN